MFSTAVWSHQDCSVCKDFTSTWSSISSLYGRTAFWPIFFETQNTRCGLSCKEGENGMLMLCGRLCIHVPRTELVFFSQQSTVLVKVCVLFQDEVWKRSCFYLLCGHLLLAELHRSGNCEKHGKGSQSTILKDLWNYFCVYFRKLK